MQPEYFPLDEEDGEMDETKRKSRNLSEKKRRDQFNMLINELNSVVSLNGRKMDKSNVLKAAMNTLKLYNENVARSREYEINEEWKPSFLSNEEYTHLMLETLGGFIVVFSSCGKILHVSSRLATKLGYALDEMLNLNIYDLVTENDRSHLENTFLISTVNNLYMHDEDNSIKFKCFFLRKFQKINDVQYEPVEFIGKMKSQEVQNFPTDRDKLLEFNKPLIFSGFIRLLTPQLYCEVSLRDHLKSEFISHHNFEWKFLFLDERAPLIIGYSPFEVLGTSGYDYYHIDDLDDIVDYHKNLMAQNKGISGYYRFLTKGHEWIWLQTSSYITRRQWNSRIEFIICTHRVIDPVNTNKKTDENEVKIFDNTPSFSSNGSTSCSTKTSPPSWQSTTSTTSTASDSNYCEEEDKSERPASRRCKDFLLDDHSTTSSSSHNFQHYKKRKTLKKNHHFHKSYGEYPGSSSDTSSSNSIGSNSTPGSIQIMKNSIPTTENVDVNNIKNPSLEACLQQKCAELQQIIADRQEELRVVSEQLFMARSNPPLEENMNSTYNPEGRQQITENLSEERCNPELHSMPFSYEN